ncbi:hypothetical protein DFJ63DRAFT_310161 [Scheffersomyces coipomensis]|uniref:uncharacterized protein n=1 Tax=Scheffersomyces coipomensis TaxID=1788519 RepID=UPI00315D498A
MIQIKIYSQKSSSNTNEHLLLIHSVMMDTTSKESSPSKPTNNLPLPSFEVLYQTSQRADSSLTRHHSQDSNLSLQSKNHSPQVSISNPPYIYNSPQGYSHTRIHHSRDESYPYPFDYKYPAAQGVALTRETPPSSTPVYKRPSTQLTFGRPNVEKPADVYNTLRRTFECITDLENFGKTYSGLYNTMNESIAKDVTLQGSFAAKQEFDKIFRSFSVGEVDTALSKCDSLKSSLQEMKDHMLESIGSRPILGGVVEGSSSMRESVSASPASPTKKRKKAIHERSISVGGELMDMRITAPALIVEGHQEKIDQGGLNPDLSIRERIITCNHCGADNTPEWRSGPDGSRTLCNACGLFYSKLIRKNGPENAKVIMQQRKADPTDRRILP